MSGQKKLLVVGYGVAGSQTACAMAKKGGYSIVVLTPIDYMEVPLSMTMVMAMGPEAHDKVLFPLLRDPGIEFIIGTARTINDNSVTTSAGQVITFDVCVLATGQNMSIYSPNPETEPTRELRKANIEKIYNNIKAAKTIVISGGRLLWFLVHRNLLSLSLNLTSLTQYNHLHRTRWTSGSRNCIRRQTTKQRQKGDFGPWR